MTISICNYSCWIAPSIPTLSDSTTAAETSITTIPAVAGTAVLTQPAAQKFATIGKASPAKSIPTQVRAFSVTLLFYNVCMYVMHSQVFSKLNHDMDSVN